MQSNMFDQIDAVIFDLDGTVVDSMWMWREIDIEYLSRYGLSLPNGLQETISGMSFSETAIYFQDVIGINESIENIKSEWNRMAMEKYCTKVFPKPFVVELLQWLKRKGFKTGIATSNSIELAMAALSSNELLPYFDEIHTSCEVVHGKPSPDIYLLVARCLEVPADRCLVFEDIIQGIMAAKNAGMKVCGVEDAFSAESRMEKLEQADYYIDSYDEIKELIDEE